MATTAVTANYLSDTATPMVDITVTNTGTTDWPTTTIISAYYVDSTNKATYFTSLNPAAAVVKATGTVNFALALGATTSYSASNLFVGVTVVTTTP